MKPCCELAKKDVEEIAFRIAAGASYISLDDSVNKFAAEAHLRYCAANVEYEQTQEDRLRSAAFPIAPFRCER